MFLSETYFWWEQVGVHRTSELHFANVSTNNNEKQFTDNNNNHQMMAMINWSSYTKYV